MPNRKRQNATTVVGQTVVHERRKFSRDEKRALFASVIGHLPEKVVAGSADNSSVQAVRLWKAEDRTIGSHELLDLAHDYDSVWKYICVAAGRAGALRRVDASFHDEEIRRLSAEVAALKAMVERKQ